ncbi:hypothetical protein F7725_008234 [Dissostichus mawsoni]|uniref:SH2 domain-containing protein n=1 Tax=Dissostichus mawsoni TaxID=36200 RepID=A0A7J5Y7S7_DISMA|nr:hypothetical protein F7725_008234 [Dissostichus mawsoni]
MAKWLKDYLNFGSRRDPPQVPRPDYSESDILRAYRAQKELDFEDPYQHSDKEHRNGGFSPCKATVSLPSFPAFDSVLPSGLEVKVVSPKHRLIKVDSQEFGCSKVPLSPVTIQEEPGEQAASDDERPADEYDQPGSVKKDNISKALAVQFEGAERERSRAQTDQTRLTKTGTCSTASESTLRLVETLLLSWEREWTRLCRWRDKWYHGALSRSEAESLLTLCKESSYLVRNSQTGRNEYSLSLR